MEGLMMTSFWNMRIASSRGRSIMAATAALLFLLPAGALSQSASEAITLNSGATILVDSKQPVPIRLPAHDLASDIQKVFGNAPRIISPPQDAGPVTIVLGDEASGAPADHDSAPEAFSITTGTASLRSGSKAQVIRLAGSDMRRTLLALYP